MVSIKGGGTRRIILLLSSLHLGTSQCRGISRRAVVCSSSSSWRPAFGLKLLTRPWALGKGPVRLVLREARSPFRNSRIFGHHSAANGPFLPRRVSARAKNRITKQNQSPPGHKTTHRHTNISAGACLCAWATRRVVMSPRARRRRRHHRRRRRRAWGESALHGGAT